MILRVKFSRFYRIGVYLFIVGVIQYCAPAPRYTSKNPASSVKNIPNRQKQVKSKGLEVVEVFTGMASFYGKDFHGKLTANGEVYDMYGLTAAHKTLPLNTIIRVTNLSNGKAFILRINDRGPFIDGRILDCSYGAAKKLGFVTQGLTEVKIEILEWGDDEYMKHD